MAMVVARRYGADAAMYGLLLRHGAGPSCEDAAVQELLDMLRMVCHPPLVCCKVYQKGWQSWVAISSCCDQHDDPGLTMSTLAPDLSQSYCPFFAGVA